jgi:hypothetical protein
MSEKIKIYTDEHAPTAVLEENAELRPEFETSLKRSLEQAQVGEGIDLETFRARLGR